MAAEIARQTGYASGNLGKSVVWTTFETFLLYYLVTVAGLSPAATGTILVAAMLWDAVADGAVGYITDRYGHGKTLGRHIIFAAPLCALGFWLIFFDPGEQLIGGTIRIIAAVALARIGYTLCDVAHNSLIVRAAPTPETATRVSGLRLCFSAIGIALVGMCTATIFGQRTSVERDALIGLLAGVGGGLYVATLYGAYAATRHLPAPMPVPRQWNPADALAILWQDRPLRRLFAMAAVQASLIPLFAKTLPFFAMAVHGNVAWAGHALIVIAVFHGLAIPIWIAASGRISASRMLTASHCVALAGLAILALAGGSFPETAALGCIGVAQAGMNMAIWAMLATAIGHGVGRSHGLEALPVGLFIAILKVAAGMGTALLATILAISAGSGTDPVALLPRQQLVVFFSLAAPAAGCLICLMLARWGSARTGSMPFRPR